MLQHHSGLRTGFFAIYLRTEDEVPQTLSEYRCRCSNGLFPIGNSAPCDFEYTQQRLTHQRNTNKPPDPDPLPTITYYTPPIPHPSQHSTTNPSLPRPDLRLCQPFLPSPSHFHKAFPPPAKSLASNNASLGNPYLSAPPWTSIYQPTENRFEGPTARDLRKFQIMVAWMAGGCDLHLVEGKEIQVE